MELKRKCERCGCLIGVVETRRNADSYGTRRHICTVCLDIETSTMGRIRQCGVSELLHDLTLEHVYQHAMAESWGTLLEVHEWLEGTQRGGHPHHYLWGEAGAGKTLLASALALTLARHQRDVHLIQEGIWYGLPANRNDEMVVAHHRLDYHTWIDVLFFDDLGSRDYNHYGMQCLRELVEQRKHRPTLWIGRQSPYELLEWLRLSRRGLERHGPATEYLIQHFQIMIEMNHSSMLLPMGEVIAVQDELVHPSQREREPGAPLD